MNSESSVISPSAPTKSKIQLVPLVEIYVDQTFGEDFWDTMMLNQEFQYMILQVFPKYGDSVFSEVVDYIVAEKMMPVEEFLRNFSDFLHQYYL